MWFVLDAVAQIDLKPFYKKYRTDGVGKVLTANQSPDHCTSSRFRKENPQLDWVLYVIFTNKALQFYTEIPKAIFVAGYKS